MNRFTRISAFVFFITSASLSAQVDISGMVTNVQGTPLAGANVYLAGTDLGSATDTDGKYGINNVNAGTYTLHI